MKTIQLQPKDHPKMGEAAIIEKVLSGDTELYELLMRRNNQKLYRIIAGYLKDPQEIADTMQDTYLKAYENLSKFKSESLFSTWLIRIGINEALQKLRKRGKFIRMFGKYRELYGSAANLMETNNPNPEKQIMQQEAKQLLEQAISKLKPKYRSVFIMKEVEGMSMAEISECLDISIPNIKSRLHRAKKKLKNNLYGLSNATDTYEFGFSRCDNLVEKVLNKL